MRALWFIANVVLMAAFVSSNESFEGSHSSFGRGCPNGHFECSDGDCILLKHRCDYEDDCSDGSDEKDCDIHDSFSSCRSDYFQCDDRECILHEKHCDHKEDCSDGSDEINCGLIWCEEPDFFKCDNGVCIDHEMVCDGKRDCHDGSDEELPTCPHNIEQSARKGCLAYAEFKCGDGLCIPKAWICDGEVNCMDSSDESPALCSKHHCALDEFQCRNGRCIIRKFECDGADDCKDGSDEENCPDRVIPPEECTLENKAFLCKDKLHCIQIYKLCDGHRDCLDDSDEGGKCNETAECHDANCSTQQCYSSPDGHFCLCAQGYKYEKGACVDIDECQNFGVCDQKCENTPGSYRCLCDHHYILQKDMRTCRAEGPEEAKILYSLGNDIGMRYLKSNMQHHVRNVSQAVGVECDGHHLYWSNIYDGQEAIMKAELLGTDRRPIVTAGLGEPEDLAVDWITENIYFTDSRNDFIGVCSSNGKHCAVLHNRDINNPRGIALLPNEGYMFWSDWGDKPVIARSGMDGSDVFDFVSKDLQWPNGITIDHGNQRLYWVDAKLSTIESIRLDGKDRWKVLEGTVHHPYSVAVFEDTLYWSDWDTLEIESANKFTGKNRKTVVQERTRIFGIKIYHPAMQDRDQINYCFGAPCTDLCLLAPVGQGQPAGRGYTCACPEGKQLSANNHSCIVTDKKQIIVIGSRDRLFQYEHKRLGLAHVEELPLEQRTAMLGDVSVIEYNSLDGSLIVGDAHNRKMSAVNMDTLETRDIVTKDVGRIEGIAFDNLGSNIYWTDSELGKVEVINTHNHHRKIIMNHLQGDIPRGIAVIPSEGIMFVSLSSPRGAHIDKISMANGDVHSRTHMFEENLMGPFLPLFFDRMSELVFWADSASRRIEYTSPGGQERHTYAVLGVSPIDITSVGTDIFWTSSGTKRINYANKLLSDSDIKNVDLSGYVYSNSKIFITALRGIDSKRIHPCAYSNGNCSHLCLVSPKKDVQMECACPDGMYLEQPTQCAVLPACKRTEFECQLSSVTGIIRHCIPLNQKCNGRKDCPGGEDEDLAMCAEKELHKCLPGQFACLDGRRCIDESLVCNLLPDCDDHSDETAECGHSLGVCNSSTGRFQCGSGECVSEQRRCDSQIDCRDMSDEKECAERSCDTQTQFRCKSGSCIVKQFECDGDLDCADGSDEHKDCTYIRTCSPQQMTCDNGQCIDEELKCNGVNDCDDSSDERSCPQRHHTVESHLHHRASSPEGAAPSLPDCDNRYQFACESANSPDRCLPAAVRCNGTSECRNGEDELNCAGCHMDEFQCKNNRCVYHTWLCDRKDDCGDNSDEEAAVCQANSGGKLGSGTGVAKSDLRCFGSFRCTSDPSECIQTSMVCNGEKDCSDGSDEGALCDKGCENAGCTDNMCQRTPTGPKCACAKGYELMGDAKTCEDIDECATEEYCSQLCTNTPGAFSCSCHPQYVLRQDGMSCKAKGGEMQFVYAVYNEIRTMSGWHSHLGIVYSDPDFQMRVSGLAADVGRKHVYWTSATNDSLYRVSTENRRQVRSAHLERPSHLSMDWVTGNVYVVEATSQITAVNFEKRTYARLYKSDPAMNIEAFAVDPIMRTMFWSERLAHKVPFSSIYRSDTSGSNLVKVISNDLTQVSDIFIDTFHNQIYWADTATRKIERAFFDGSHRELVFNFTDVPTDITIFEDYMYVLVQPRLSADLKEMEEIGNVWRCGLYGSALDKCDQFRIHPKHFTTPYHFDIIHPGLQLKGHNDCSNSSECLEAGGTCLLRNHKLRPSAVCVCADGTRLRKDNVCPPDQQGSIFEGRDEIDTQLSARSPFNPKESFISVWWLVIGFVFVVVPVVGILFFVYRGGRPSPINPQWLPSFCTRRFPFHTIRFNSKFGNMDADDTIPAYSDFQFHPCQLNPGEHQYENPIAAMQEQNGAVTIKTMNEIDIQVGPEKTGWMGMDGMHGSPSEAGSESSTIEIAGVSNGDNCRTLLL